MRVLDASALLCFLLGEIGSETVEELLSEGAACSPANWSETAQRILAAEGDWDLARLLLQSSTA